MAVGADTYFFQTYRGKRYPDESEIIGKVGQTLMATQYGVALPATVNFYANAWRDASDFPAANILSKVTCIQTVG